MYYDYVEPYYDIPRECQACQDLESMIDVSREYIDSIVKMLYGSQRLDLLKMEDNIIELCHAFGVVMPMNELNITITK